MSKLTALMKAFDIVQPTQIKASLKELLIGAQYFARNGFNSSEEVFGKVEVEINSHCNRRCSICPVSSDPFPVQYMDRGVYSLILQQLADIQYKGIFTPVRYNEPTLDERLPELMNEAKEAIPRAHILVYTNGSRLRREYIEKLVDSGVDTLFVSIFEDNLESDDCRALLGSLPAELNGHIRFRILTSEMGLLNRGGAVSVQNPTSKRFCFQASYYSVIDINGNVILCCNDYYGKHKFGNVKEHHIKDIWNDPEYRKTRKRLRQGKFEREICKQCAGRSVWYEKAHKLQQPTPHTIKIKQK